MRFTTYSKYKGKWLDALNLQALLEHLSDFLMDGGFAGGPHYHPYWGWSGDEDVELDGRAEERAPPGPPRERPAHAGDDRGAPRRG